MYGSAFDGANALLVARLSAGGDESQDFPRHIERMVSAADEAAGLPHRLCILVIFEREHSLPSPKIRKAVSDAMARESFHPHLTIVTQNPLVRGVITALSWLRKPAFDIKMVGTTEEAIAWLEAKRGEPLPRLVELLARVASEQSAGQ